MKILFVAPSAYLLGGVQDWLYMIVLGLRQKGYDIQVAVPNDHFHNGHKYNEYYPGINATFFSNKTGTSRGRINALAELLIKSNADIITGVNIGDLYQAYMRAHPYIRKSRIVMTLHAIEADYLGDIGRYSPLLDGVITTNRLTQKIINNLQLIENELILYSPYGVKNVKNVKNKVDADILNHLRIAWVGRLDNQQKRIFDLCNILPRLDQYKVPYILSIAGDGPEKNKLKHDLSPWMQTGKVRFVGLLTKDKLEHFYQQNDILLITSEWETGPIVAWEAILSGLVVVSSEYLGISSENALINDQTALLFPVGSDKKAAQQISRLLDRNLFQQIACRAKMTVSSRYSLNASLTSWESAFLTIMESKVRRKKTLRLPLFQTSGKLERLIGTYASEIIRRFAVRKGYCRDPGSEWPHCTYPHTNANLLFEYAKLLEQLS